MHFSRFYRHLLDWVEATDFSESCWPPRLGSLISGRTSYWAVQGFGNVSYDFHCLSCCELPTGESPPSNPFFRNRIF